MNKKGGVLVSMLFLILIGLSVAVIFSLPATYRETKISIVLYLIPVLFFIGFLNSLRWRI